MIGRMIDAAFSSWTSSRMDEHLPYPPSRTALLLVDVQRAFFDPEMEGARLLADVAEKLAWRDNLERLVSACRERGVSVVHCPFRLPSDEDTDGSTDIPYLEKLRERGVLLEDRPDTEKPATLSSETDVVLQPRRTLNVFYGTQLQDELRDRSISHLLVAGSVANASVDSTGRMGVELDFDVTYVSDCIAALDWPTYEASIAVTFHRMANRVIGSERVLEHLG